MNLIRFFFRGAPAMMACSFAAALLSGACNAGLIAMVNTVLAHEGSPARWLIWSFVALGAGRLLTNFAAQITLAYFSQRSSANLRRELATQILSVPLRQLEEVGAPRIMVTVTEDVLVLTEAMLCIP